MRPMATIRPARASRGKFLAWTYPLSNFLLAAAFVLTSTNLFLRMDSGWPEAAFILLATFSTLTALTRQLPSQNVLLAASIIALIGGAAHALGAISGIPFG